jgi:hypothetical protein
MKLALSAAIYVGFYVASLQWHSNPSDIPYPVHKLVFGALFPCWLLLTYGLNKCVETPSDAGSKPLALCGLFVVAAKVLMGFSMYYSCRVQKTRAAYVPATLSDTRISAPSTEGHATREK